MKFETAQDVPAVENPKAKEIFEKGKNAFEDSYETALMFRNFRRGWGEFSDKEGMHVSLRLSRLASRAENSATAALSKNSAIDERWKKEMIAESISLQAELTAFARMKNLPDFPVNVQWLRESLEAGDKVEILKASVSIRNMMLGIEYMNELLLCPADKETETSNTLNK